MQVNDIVTFSPRAGESAEGIVTRVWDKPASDPYVTVQTTGEDMSRTFTRFASAVQAKATGWAGHSHEWDFEPGAEPSPYMCQACKREHGDPYAFAYVNVYGWRA
jgi:hypothetical protein